MPKPYEELCLSNEPKVSIKLSTNCFEKEESRRVVISPLSGQVPQVDRWEPFQTVGVPSCSLRGLCCALLLIQNVSEVTFVGSEMGRYIQSKRSEPRGGRRWCGKGTKDDNLDLR